ncbi:LysR family transcriptional regulator [Pseudoduganella sp. RAF19]|uniref:LysR family transcriptional regulator n=1 Tax=Pseudoduganella sp. RAF19 TaxID=3233052 RepID=UPI003F9502E2
MLRFDDLSVFVSTADHGSLSAAARILDISPAMASAALKRLEGELKLRLFARTTRSLRLTDEGEHYLRHAREALRLLKEGHETLIGKDAFSGTLKISFPSDVGRNVILPWLDKFQAQYPGVSYQINVSDRRADMTRLPVDLAIRYGKLEDSSLVAMPITADNRRVLVASPEYVRQHGRLNTLDDLRRHNCLRFALEDMIYDRWAFAPQNGEASVVQVSGNRWTNDSDLVRRWAVAGLGIAYKSRLDMTADLKAGRLQVLLPEIAGEEVPLQLVCQHRSQVTPIVIQLRDFLRAQVEQM